MMPRTNCADFMEYTIYSLGCELRYGYENIWRNLPISEYVYLEKLL